MTTLQDVEAVVEAYLAAEKTPLEAQIMALESELHTAALDRAADAATIAELTARIHELEALLNPFTTKFGASRPDNTPSIRTVDVYRSYLSPSQRPSLASGDFSLRERAPKFLSEDSALWLSIKAFPEGWFESLLKDLRNVFPTQKFLLTCRHEPREFWDAEGGLTISRYHEFQTAFEDIVESVGDTNTEMWTIFEGYHRPSRSPGYYDTMRRVKQNLGFDAYNPGIQQPNRGYVSPSEIFDEILEYAAANGTANSAIAETGTGLWQSDIPGRLQWVKDVRAYLDGKVKYAAMWNQGTIIMTEDEASAWLG